MIYGKVLLKLTVILSLLCAGCATNLKINEIEHSSQPVPDSFNGYRIVFISDLHINSLLPREYFEEVMDQVVSLEPDLVLLGGDYVDGDTQNIEEALEVLRPLQSYPCIAVLGNHDHWESSDEVLAALEDLGIEVLLNRSMEISLEDQSILVCGVDDLYFGYPDIEAALERAHVSQFTILLSHSPEIYTEIQYDPRVDLMLAGHSHGGQVTLFGLWAPVLPLADRQFWRGSYESDYNRLIISNGVGVNKLPIRVFASPGIELIRLGTEE